MSSPTLRIPLMKSTFYNEDRTRAELAEFIRTTPCLSMGEHCAQYERGFARQQQREHAVVVTNGSMANLVLLQALMNLGRLKRGDRVGFSALTWATNPMPIFQLGLIPVALDCNLRSLNTGSAELAATIDSLQAVFITHVLGFCDDIHLVADMCRKRGIVLIEDTCESLGSRHRGKLLGNFGIASTFSTFVGHHLSTIEGGMICTDDPDLADMLILVRAHGWDRNVSPQFREKLRKEHNVTDFFAKYTFYDLAYNARPTEIVGFLGHTQLPYWEEIFAKRAANFARFQAAVGSRNDRYQPLNVSHMEFVSNFAMPVLCRDAAECVRRLQAFTDAGVEVRPIIAGDVTQHPFFRKYASPAPCPNAALAHAQGFYFPNHPELTEEEVDLLCSLLTA